MGQGVAKIGRRHSGCARFLSPRAARTAPQERLRQNEGVIKGPGDRLRGSETPVIVITARVNRIRFSACAKALMHDISPYVLAAIAAVIVWKLVRGRQKRKS